MAVCECAPYVSQVFSVELKPVLPYFLFWFLFPMDNFFSSSTVSFIAMEIAFVQTIPMPAWNERSGKKKESAFGIRCHTFSTQLWFVDSIFILTTKSDRPVHLYIHLSLLWAKVKHISLTYIHVVMSQKCHWTDQSLHYQLLETYLSTVCWSTHTQN